VCAVGDGPGTRRSAEWSGRSLSRKSFRRDETAANYHDEVDVRMRDAPRVSRNCRVRAIVRVLSARSAQVATPEPRPATLPDSSKTFYVLRILGYGLPFVIRLDDFANKLPQISHDKSSLFANNVAFVSCYSRKSQR